MKFNSKQFKKVFLIFWILLISIFSIGTTINQLNKDHLNNVSLSNNVNELNHIHNENCNHDDLTKNINVGNGFLDVSLTPIHFTGKDNYVWLLYSEGIKEEDWTNYINFLYRAFEKIFSIEPMNKFANFINVYATNTISNENYSGLGNLDTFFKLEYRITNSMKPFDGTKTQYIIDSIRKQLFLNYFSQDTKLFHESILVGSKGWNKFRSFALSGKTYSYISLHSEDNFKHASNVILHEASHAFGYLNDEYESSAGGSRNAVPTLEKAKENWSEFVNYVWYQPEYFTDNLKMWNVIDYHKSSNKYIPSDPYGYPECIMYNSGASRVGFCPVCRYYMFDRLNESFDNKYDWFWLKPNVVFDSNGDPYFRTVYKNYTNQTKNIKIKIWDNAKNKTYEETFSITPNKNPQKILIGNQSLDDALQNSIINSNTQWQIIDTDENKVIYSSEEQYLNISLKFVDENNENLSNDNLTINKEQKLKILKNSNFKIDPPYIRGYKFINELNELNLDNINEEKTVTLKYKKLNSKEITLNLMDMNNQAVIQNKKFKVYENESFIPSDYEWRINYGSGYYGKPLNNNSLSYDAISDSNNIVTYVKSYYARIEYVGKQTYKLGEEHPTYWQDLIKTYKTYKNMGSSDIVYAYNVEFKQWDYKSTVDWNTPTLYKLCISWDDSFFDYELNEQIKLPISGEFYMAVVDENGNIPGLNDFPPSEPSNPNPEPKPEVPPTPSIPEEKPEKPNPPIVPEEPIIPEVPSEPTPPKPSENQTITSAINNIKQINANKNKTESDFKIILDINEQKSKWSKEEQEYFIQQCKETNIDFDNLVLEAQNFVNNNSNNNSSNNLLWLISIPVVIILLAGVFIAIHLIKKKNKTLIN